nr:hypothetical protein Iba_chr03bCG4130 [Ipomoea batatas]
MTTPNLHKSRLQPQTRAAATSFGFEHSQRFSCGKELWLRNSGEREICWGGLENHSEQPDIETNGRANKWLPGLQIASQRLNYTE